MTLTSTTGFRAAIGAASAALLVVLATPTPAFAGNVTVSGSAVDVGEQPGTSSVSVMGADMGESKQVRVSVTATGEAASFVNVEVADGTCKANGATANCGKLRMGETKDFSVKVSLKENSGLKAGETKSGNLEFKVEGPNTGSGSPAPLTVTGVEQVATSIAGTVTDLDKKPIKGAKVSTTDYGSATTDGQGKFSIEAEVQPDTAIEYTVTKSGFKDKKDTYTATAGQPIQIDVMMDEKDSAKSEAPRDEETGNDSGDSEEGFTATTWILIILGILLAIGGVIAIWMLLRKGKEEEDDDDRPLPPEPPTHQLSASQTGKFGVYEASGVRPGADNPTMMYNGGLINDNDLARYGSEAPPAATGFGPAYGDSRPTQAVQSAHDLPPAGATQRYPSAEPTSGAAGYGNDQYAGSTQRYPAADPVSGAGRYGNDPVSGAGRYPNEPVSGSTQRYPAAEPASGAWNSGEPASGSTQRYPAAEPASGAWNSNAPVSGSTQRYPAAEPQSGAWNSNDPGQQGQRYPAEPTSGARYPAADQYYGQNPQQDDRAAGGRHYREADGYGTGYDDQQSQRPSGRRYRDDDYGDFDDRPRSW
ncbi:carboxypeptidase-like regulatory domain-containing protein [Stackebrandtia nassauensis]|uniref:Carboxypeptidase regulatory-like domain-containing protein n=1 Tax=Stackebrandtia nassauensis (strain DSM 44728 / CIP 108903 / NRRL B-16338 / NBRC 102104 / LLR-40K-21) TaxID=446470 RepID=D3Q2L5_STANL|nr:carboxypeptidase-like regulatory domain-containing protein [Stackebrandtia nassauensis]ADD45766.1 hypothetical protein Snas_6143 [Stackebrandtia nassauensis DSM 44728]